MPRKPQRRKAKKSRVLRAKAPAKPKTPPQTVENPLKAKAKHIGLHILDVAEKDPEKFLNGLARAVEGVEKTYTFFQTNPREASRVIRAAAVGAVAKAAKRKLEQS